MTAQNAEQSTPATANRTVFADCLDKILAARRLETAMPPQQRADETLIPAHEDNHRKRRHSQQLVKPLTGHPFSPPADGAIQPPAFAAYWHTFSETAFRPQREPIWSTTAAKPPAQVQLQAAESRQDRCPGASEGVRSEKPPARGVSTGCEPQHPPPYETQKAQSGRAPVRSRRQRPEFLRHLPNIASGTRVGNRPGDGHGVRGEIAGQSWQNNTRDNLVLTATIQRILRQTVRCLRLRSSS